MNGRSIVRAGDFASTFISTFPDSFIRFAGSPLLASVNLAIILSLAGLLICLIGRWVTGTLLAVGAVVALAAANQVKLELLQEPITWQDMAMLRDMTGLLREFLAWSHFAIIALGLAVIVLAYRLDAPLNLPRLRPRLRLLGLVFCALVPAGLIAMPSTTADRYLGLPDMNDTRRDYQQVLTSWSRNHGMLLSLLLSHMQAEITQPAEYGPRTVASVASTLVRQTARQSPARTPHVVAVMYESLWDVTQVPGVTITPDPLQTFRSPPGNAQAFKMLSPVFGRPTANVEFEFLTGMSTSFLPNGVIPYMDMMHDDVPSLPKLLRESGYRALAIHPYNCEFWHRDVVYPQLGFERFEDIVGFYPSDVKGHYVSDDAVASHIIRCIDEAKKPTFLFAVTMQNHAPHERSQYDHYNVSVAQRHSGVDDDALLAYTQGVYDADRSLRKLIDHFSQSDEPVVLIAFGDHLVPLANIYSASGYLQPGREDSPTQRVKMRATPAVIWTNMAEPLPEIAPITSPNLVSPSLLGYLGMSDPYFTGLLGKVRDASPGLSRYVHVTAAGKPVLGEPEGSRQVLRDYGLLQHDLLLGKRYALQWLNVPEDHSATAALRTAGNAPRLQ